MPADADSAVEIEPRDIVIPPTTINAIDNIATIIVSIVLPGYILK